MVTEEAVSAAENSHICLKPLGALGLKGLSNEDCTRIHQASLELLNTMGVMVTSTKAQSFFADHGAVVDQATNRVCLPPELVERSLATIPSTICIPGRDPSRDYTMGADNLGFVNFGSTVWLNDP